MAAPRGIKAESLLRALTCRCSFSLTPCVHAQLTTLNTVLHSLNAIQRKWVYLEPIFARGAIPTHQQRFRTLDEQFRGIMTRIAVDPRCTALVAVPGITETCAALSAQLERCQQALAAYLEEKRERFPRFYFVGDEDLLEILGQAQNPAVIQAHLKKLFQGVHAVELSADARAIVAMKSAAGPAV